MQGTQSSERGTRGYREHRGMQEGGGHKGYKGIRAHKNCKRLDGKE